MERRQFTSFIQAYMIKNCVFKINIYLTVFTTEKSLESVLVIEKGEIIKTTC